MLVGCNGTDSATGAADEVTYRVGYAGPVIEAVPGMPPAKLADGQSFEIGLRICNQGTFDISEGEIQLSGFDSTYILADITSHTFPQNALTLEAKNALNPAGGCTNILTFPAKVIAVEDGYSEYPVTYYLTTTSKQLFELSQTVCVGGTSAYLVEDGGCNIDAPIQLNGQGSMLGVSRIDTVAQGGPARILFDLQLTNGGKGTVKSASITKAQLGGKELNCVFKKTKTRTYTFGDNLRGPAIFCEAPMETGVSSYPTTLFLQVFYDYEQYEINQILIEGSADPSSQVVSPLLSS